MYLTDGEQKLHKKKKKNPFSYVFEGDIFDCVIMKLVYMKQEVKSWTFSDIVQTQTSISCFGLFYQENYQGKTSYCVESMLLTHQDMCLSFIWISKLINKSSFYYCIMQTSMPSLHGLTRCHRSHISQIQNFSISYFHVYNKIHKQNEQ